MNIMLYVIKKLIYSNIFITRDECNYEQLFRYGSKQDIDNVGVGTDQYLRYSLDIYRGCK